jgi:hypothetical protein
MMKLSTTDWMMTSRHCSLPTEIRETPLADAEQNHETDSNDNQLESDAGEEEFEGDDDEEMDMLSDPDNAE